MRRSDSRALPARSLTRLRAMLRAPYEPKKPPDADQPEDPEDLRLRERKAGEQIRPAEATEEVAGP